ncbi:hypothetical protein GCM10023187_10030 [Nibrella viscosa]|uniref:Uncharacterized protein n=1 Tax=Nibrella viscosa TaxID=1084524 RepID=A0ABP8K0G0_9BACT
MKNLAKSAFFVLSMIALATGCQSKNNNEGAGTETTGAGDATMSTDTTMATDEMGGTGTMGTGTTGTQSTTR